MSAKGTELAVTGTNSLRVRDVLVGDLWLCSGQSNMGFVVSRGLDAEKEIAAANYPLIRLFDVARTVAAEPAMTARGNWQTCSPQTAANFPAAAYYFAREMHLKTGVPVGLLHASWGGTQIESWMSASALAGDPAAREIETLWQKRLVDYPRMLAEYEKMTTQWEAERAAASAAGKDFTKPKPPRAEGPNSRWQPAGLYNAMIAPFVPAALRGILWYQGEANAPRAAEYASLFKGLIRQWRADFGEELPFYFVQLANYDRKADKTLMTWAYLREAQQEALVLPHTGMVVAIDIGEVGDVHPRNKQEVGRRLALIARHQLENEPVEFSGPLFKSATKEGPAMRVAFTHAAGLKAGEEGLTGFELAGEDRNFVPAKARIEGDTVIVRAENVPAPVAVRYAWHNFPQAGLFNSAGLPAAPFRSVRWE